MPEDARLLNVASAVAEGSDVDWDEVERALDDRARAIVRELRLIADIAHVARNPTSQRTGPGTESEAASASHPSTWGHLRLLEQIGRGSFGAIYRAWDTRLERDVALKLVPPSVPTESFDLSRALKEARLLARVRHHNVVTVFGADCHDGRFGLWMELIDGLTLDALVTAQGTMSGREAAAIGVDVCHALAAVHQKRLLHRDIKATNVMREDGGRILLMDFGVSWRVDSGHEPVGGPAGTPLYLAPELLAGRKPSAASDIYSLGVLLFYLVTSRYPVTGTDRRDVALAHERGRRVSLRDARPNLPSTFVDVVEHALSPDPKQRYGTAGEFGAALASVAGITYVPDPRRMPDWRVAAAAAVGIAALAGVAKVGQDRWFQVPHETRSGIAVTTPRSPEPFGPRVDPTAYQVAAAFYAVRNGQNVRLTAGSRVAPGDNLFLTLEASRPVFVYIVNQDEIGQSYLLFPLPGHEPGNPIPLGKASRLPGFRAGEEHFWEVTSAGGREHFFVYVAPERLTEFEQMLAALPRAEVGRPVESAPLSAEAVGVLRGVGGLKQAGKTSFPSNAPSLADLQPLPDMRDAATGVWARRITFENPAR